MSDTSGSYVIAKVDIDTYWGVIQKGSVGLIVHNFYPNKGFIDFGKPYPIAAFDQEVRHIGPLELLAIQAT